MAYPGPHSKAKGGVGGREREGEREVIGDY